jgi:hypothetical protein
MTLDDLCDAFHALRFPVATEAADPELAQVRAGRSAVEAAVIDDEFLADCISAELRLLEAGRVRRELTPFVTASELGIQFAFGYWPPGARAGAHEHAGWTITAVCRNHLDVVTYDREQSYRRGELVPKNQFHAPAGRVGFIFDPCIHEPRNTSQDWSLSLHVIGPHDSQRPCDQPTPLAALNARPRRSPAERDHPYASVEAARQRKAFVHQLARILASMDVAQAPALLARCAVLGPPATRTLIERMPGRDRHQHPIATPRFLTRVHRDLDISCRDAGDMVALDVETPDGRLEAFAINDVARDAMAFVATEPVFEVHAMPGDLSEAERESIAAALEESGLFARVAP